MAMRASRAAVALLTHIAVYPVLAPPAAAAFEAMGLPLAVGASGANRAVAFEFVVLTTLVDPRRDWRGWWGNGRRHAVVVA